MKTTNLSYSIAKKHFKFKISNIAEERRKSVSGSFIVYSETYETVKRENDFQALRVMTLKVQREH